MAEAWQKVLDDFSGSKSSKPSKSDKSKKSSTPKKKKKQGWQEVLDDFSGSRQTVTYAPYNASSVAERVKARAKGNKKKDKEDEEEDDRKWYEKGLFEDGYDFGDLTKTILGISDDTASFKDLTVNSVKRGYYNSLYGEESYDALLGEENQRDEYKKLLESEEYQFTPGSKVAKAVSGASELIGQQIRQFTNPRTLGFVGAAVGTAAVAGQAGPQVLAPEEVVTIPGAAIAAFTAGSAASNYEIEAGHAYNEMVDSGISEETARKVSIGVGGINAALEALQVDELFDAYKALKKSGATKNVTKRILDELLARGYSVAKETGQEVLQEGVTIGGVQLASQADKGEYAYSSDAVAKRLLETAESSALSFGMLNAPAGARNTYSIIKDSKTDPGKPGTTQEHPIVEQKPQVEQEIKPQVEEVQPIVENSTVEAKTQLPEDNSTVNEQKNLFGEPVNLEEWATDSELESSDSLVPYGFTEEDVESIRTFIRRRASLDQEMAELNYDPSDENYQKLSQEWTYCNNMIEGLAEHHPDFVAQLVAETLPESSQSAEVTAPEAVAPETETSLDEAPLQVAEEVTAPEVVAPETETPIVDSELQRLRDERQVLQDTVMSRVDAGLIDETTEALTKRWTSAHNQISAIENSMETSENEVQPVSPEVEAEVERPLTNAEKIQQKDRESSFPFEKLFKEDTRTNREKYDSVLEGTRKAQNVIANGAEGVNSISEIYGKIKGKDLKDFDAYLYHTLNIDRTTLEERYGIENRPVFGEEDKDAEGNKYIKSYVTAEESRQTVAELEAKHPDFKAIAEEVYAYCDYLLRVRLESGAITQETYDRLRDMYPRYVPISRTRWDKSVSEDLVAYLNEFEEAAPESELEDFLGNVNYASTIFNVRSVGYDLRSSMDSLVDMTFRSFWDASTVATEAETATTADIAPIPDTPIEAEMAEAPLEESNVEAPVVENESETRDEEWERLIGEDTENDSDSTSAESDTVESEPLDDSLDVTEYDPNHLMDNKKGVGKFIQNVTEVYLLDDGIPFERVAKKMGTSLDASWHAIRNSFSSAQHFIGNGNKAEGVRALTDIVKDVEQTKAKKEFHAYLGHLRNIDGMTLQSRFGLASNQNYMGRDATFAESKKMAEELEEAHPEFKKLAEDCYAYTDYVLRQYVDHGMITQEYYEVLKELYPHFIPMSHENSSTPNLMQSMGRFTCNAYNAWAMNDFGIELKDTLQTETNSEVADIDDFISRLDYGEGLFELDKATESDKLTGRDGSAHTMTVYENGKLKTFDITDEMYMALSDAHKWMDWKIPVLYQANEGFRKFCTEWNIFFSLKNGVKDPQDIIYNSNHPVETYSHLLDAAEAIVSKDIGKTAKYSHFYDEYLANGGESVDYFDARKGKFTSWKNPTEFIQYATGLKAVGAINDRVEKNPRFAEYIASREAGRTIKEAMLDSARVTTNFAAGGKLTKFLNRNGCTFLNASVQGALQHARNLGESMTDADGKLRFDTREAKIGAIKGASALIVRGLAVGMATIAINDLRWKDDEEYEELPDYVKEGYYLLFKYGDGQFFRIPKGRTNATIEEAIRQVAKESFGDDDADWDNFWNIFFENIAPNNPITNNIFAPIAEVFTGKTWYGEDMHPRRLQGEETVNQFDEKTDRLSIGLSKWLEESSFDERQLEAVKGTPLENWFKESGFGDGLSPKEINYLANSYTGVLGDMVLPHFTPKAESPYDDPLNQALAPLKDIFTTDSVMNNKATEEFYETLEVAEAKAESKDATPEDKLKSGILIGYNVEISELTKEQREIQMSDLSDSEKYQRTRELKKEINALQKEALKASEDYKVDGIYAESGDKRYNYDAEDDTWWEVKPTLANGKENPYYIQEQLSHDNLGMSYSDFWNGKKPPADFKGKTYYAEYNGKRYNYDVNKNSWFEITPKKKNGEDNPYYQSEQTAHKKWGVSYDDFWNNREAYMDAIYVAENGYEDGYGKPYYETVKSVFGLDTFTKFSSDMADISADTDANGKYIQGTKYPKMKDFVYNLDIPEIHKHILFKAEYPNTHKHNYEIIDYLNERDDISYKQMESILTELGFKVDSNGYIDTDW